MLMVCQDIAFLLRCPQVAICDIWEASNRALVESRATRIVFPAGPEADLLLTTAPSSNNPEAGSS
jgi:hypothetical protein